jgi:hypothetical protein
LCIYTTFSWSSHQFMQTFRCLFPSQVNTSMNKYANKWICSKIKVPCNSHCTVPYPVETTTGRLPAGSWDTIDDQWHLKPRWQKWACWLRHRSESYTSLSIPESKAVHPALHPYLHSPLLI